MVNGSLSAEALIVRFTVLAKIQPVAPCTKKSGDEMKIAQSYLNEQINYGGEIRTRGEVIVELQENDISQKHIDAYMMGAKSIQQDCPHFQ